MQQSGMSVTKYLQHVGINYNAYNYWRKKLKENDSPKPELAPISFTQHADPVFSSAVPSGATLLFPNGLRAHFGSGTEGILLELLNKSLSTHVLPDWLSTDKVRYSLTKLESMGGLKREGTGKGTKYQIVKLPEEIEL